MSMRRAGSISDTVKKEDVVMDPDTIANQAYETVEMRHRYQSASRGQPPVGLQEQSTTEDRIYEYLDTYA